MQATITKPVSKSVEIPQPVDFLGGTAYVDATVTYHFDNRVFTIDDIEIDRVEIEFRDGFLATFERDQINRWCQLLISELADKIQKVGEMFDAGIL